MKIRPLKNTVYLKIDKPQAGVLDTSSRNSAVEVAEVVEVGEGVDIKVGSKVFVKSWGIDIVDHGDVKYHFVNLDTNAVLAVVEDDVQQ